jgi:hypothetical protein
MITINKQINQPVPSLPHARILEQRNLLLDRTQEDEEREREREKERRISALTTNLAFILLL